MRKDLGGKLIDSIQKLSMFEIFLVSSWDISHSQFGNQSQILASRGLGILQISDPVRSKNGYKCRKHLTFSVFQVVLCSDLNQHSI